MLNTILITQARLVTSYIYCYIYIYIIIHISSWRFEKHGEPFVLGVGETCSACPGSWWDLTLWNFVELYLNPVKLNFVKLCSSRWCHCWLVIVTGCYGASGRSQMNNLRASWRFIEWSTGTVWLLCWIHLEPAPLSFATQRGPALQTTSTCARSHSDLDA